MKTFLKVVALLVLAGLVTVGVPCGGMLVLVGLGEPNMLGWGILILAIGLASAWGIFAIARSFGTGKTPSSATLDDDQAQS
ncbi:MAG: hypothetical protein EKK46_02860 [Rhodocyclaceae bacterium]|nr:MAG: hypothetical protein EKK46_02860 [Rhodocyclaceae bacterium]